MTFGIKLQDGKFFVSFCTKCHTTVWPPSEFCSVCFSESIPKDMSPIGTLIEFSKKNNEYFGLAEFDHKIRLIGKIHGDKIKEGMKIQLQNCSHNNNGYNYELIPI